MIIECDKKTKKYTNISEDPQLKVEKSQIRQKKLNYILTNFNIKYCCPRPLLEDMLEEDEYYR